MTQIALQIPQSGAPNSSEDPKVASDLSVIQTAINGNLDTTNLSANAGIMQAQLAAGALWLDATSASVDTTAVDGQLVEATTHLTVTLPTPFLGSIVGVSAASVTITGSSPVTVTASAGTIIGGGARFVASIPLGTPGSFVLLHGNGTNWVVIGGQQDSGWVPFPAVGGVIAATGYPPATRLQGDMVQGRGAMQNTTGGTISTLGTLAAPMRPAQPVQLSCANLTNLLLIATSGVVTLAPGGLANGTVFNLDGVSYSVV